MNLLSGLSLDSGLRNSSALLVSLLISLLVALVTGPTTVSAAENPSRGEPDVHDNEQKMPYVHPVLNVHHHESLYGRYLEPAQLRALNGMLSIKDVPKPWEETFSNAEMEAANQISVRIHGLSTKQVEALLGPPRSKERSFSVKDKNDDGSVESLYIVGVTPIFVRILFKNDHCSEIRCAPYDLDRRYSGWRTNDIQKQSVGKTEAEILKFEGKPTEISRLSPDSGLTNEQLKKFYAEKTGAKVWEYTIGMNTALIIMENGKCTGVPTYGYVSFGFLTKREPSADFRFPK